MRIFSPNLLRSARDHADLSRWELSRRTVPPLSPVTIRDYEKGRTRPSADALGRLSEALDCPVDTFFETTQVAS